MPSREDRGKPRIAMASKQPTSAPGHSGGAVPDSHRRSLFAGTEQELAPATRVVAAMYLRCRACQASSCRPCVASCAGRATTPAENVRVVRSCAAQFVHAKPPAFLTQRAALSRVVKNTWRHSSRFRPSADSPLCPPGQSLCPSGNQGAAVTCKCFESRNGSTGLPQKSSWTTSLGAQKPQVKKRKSTSGCSTSKGDVAR